MPQVALTSYIDAKQDNSQALGFTGAPPGSVNKIRNCGVLHKNKRYRWHAACVYAVDGHTTSLGVG